VEFRELLDMKIKNHGLQWLLAVGLSLTYWLNGGLATANVGLSETALPAVINQLATAAGGSPQVTVLSPRPDEVVNTNNVSVNLQVQGTPIFKNAALGLGPHLHVLLDRTPYQSVYDLAQPLTLTNLTPGTHTLQVLMAKPWHESWKNPGAFAQVTFHVFAKSAENPTATAPTLVYNEPDNTYGTEPVLLDFYLANAPSHRDAQQHLVNDWRVRTTINDQSFEVNQLSPFYLKGLKPGANLVKLEYLNAQGQPLDSILRVVNYQPNGTDSLSRLLRNELALNDALALFNPTSKKAAVAIAPITPAVPNSQLAWPPATPVMTPPAPLFTPPPVAVVTPAPIIAAPVISPPVPIIVPSALPAPLPAISPLPPVITVPVPVITAPLNSGFNYQIMPLPLPAPMPSPPAAVPSAILPLPAAPPTPAVPLKLPVVELPLAIKPTLPPETLRDLPQAKLSERLPVTTAPAPIPVIKIPAMEKPPAQIPAVVPSDPKESIDQTQLPTIQTPLLKKTTGESEIEFKVLAREFFHTVSVRIKKFTNSIPPKVAQWRKDLSHWIGDRSQAMQAGQKDTALE
jgi:hypothetical protein